jgi:(p)ppGpp synthase/HD superfamily hydrolase
MMSSLVRKACDFAFKAHDGQKRIGGEDYIYHPLTVMLTLAKITKETNVLAAGMLHDVMEDADISQEELKKEFNGEIAILVSELTINTKEKNKIGKRDYLAKSLMSMSDKALLIKLADRSHNVNSLMGIENKKFIRKYYKETIYILNKLTRPLEVNHLLLIAKINNSLIDLSKMYSL